jgi:hypothetical protein
MFCTFHSFANAVDILRDGFNLKDENHLRHMLFLIEEIKKERNGQKFIHKYCPGYRIEHNVSIVQFLKGLYYSHGIGIVDLVQRHLLSGTIHAVTVYVKGGGDFNLTCVDSLSGKPIKRIGDIIIVKEYHLDDDRLCQVGNAFHLITRS